MTVLDEPSSSIQERGQHLSMVDPQESMLDVPIDDPELEEALEKRETKRVARANANARYKEAHDRARGMIDALDLADGDVARCGKFRIKVSRIAPRDVSFSTSEARRVQITLLGE